MELIPIFKELVSHLQNHNRHHIDRVKSLLIQELNVIKKLEVDDSTSPVGKLVSSSSKFVKKRKSHGTNYYRK